MKRAYVIGITLLGTMAFPVVSQQVELRYAPGSGSVVRTLTTVRTVMTLVGFPGAPDGAALETEQRLSGQQFVIRAVPEGWAVEVVVDSSRARRRLAGGPWQAAIDTALVGKPARAIVGPRLNVLGIETSAPTDGTVLRVLGGWVSGLGFAFPAEPVAVGTTFPTGGRVHYDVHLSAAGGDPINAVLLGDLNMTLDSVIDRSGDRLAFLSFRGAFNPQTISAQSEIESGTASFSGGFAGRLVWSRGWNAFVSGAVSIRAQAEVDSQTDAGLTAGSVVWDATITHQVRP